MSQQLSDLFAAINQGDLQQISPGGFLLLMAISLLSSLFIAYLYVHFYSTRATGSQIHRAFPLLGISITAIFVTIQFSLPLSLGLLGALSIVRFRTPIKEPEEIGFLMIVVAVSLATATFKLAFVGIILAIGVGALLLQIVTRGLGWTMPDGTIVISLPADSQAVDPAAVTDLVRQRQPCRIPRGCASRRDRSRWAACLAIRTAPAPNARATTSASRRPSRSRMRAGLSRLGRHNLYVGFRCVR